MGDNDIITKVFQNNTTRLKRGFTWENLTYEELNYIKNRYIDSLSLYETCYRIVNKIDIHPKCPICGKLVKFGSCGKLKHFHQSCGNSQCIARIQEQTMINHFGVKNVFQKEYVKEKIKNTNLEKYNVEHVLQNKVIKQKQEQTCIQKFGTSNVFSSNYGKEKIKNTFIQHYGVDNPMKSDKIKSKFNWKEIVQKQQVTKQKNNSFNTSKIEVDSYNYLKSIYPDVVYQYKDKQRYPFICDFYIPSLDLFIECNYHWTHGGKPYKGTEEDEIKLSQWKEKAKISQFYKNAIQCWTIRDVEKRKVAKQNGIKYEIIYNYKELFLIYEKYK